jgi:hypothetical protein
MLPLFFYIAIGARIGGVVVSFFTGNRKLPLVILVLGVAGIDSPRLVLAYHAPPTAPA